MTKKIVRIGGASSFWGDSSGIAAPQLIAAGKLDYLVFDYLTESTIGLLARAKRKNTEHGYALDFIEVMEAQLLEIHQKGFRIITNAGGVNPAACAKALKSVINKLRLPAKIAVIGGDNVMNLVEHLQGKDRCHELSAQLTPNGLLSANARFGALPIKKALDAGATIVVTGCCADGALTVGALMHEFAWGADEYNKLSGASLAGRILECGTQATGAAHTDWHLVPSWAEFGYPIVEVEEDGSFVVTKPAGTGGLIVPGVISEQILKGVGNPKHYLLPDVTCDLTGVELKLAGVNRVQVTGAKGSAPCDAYIVCAALADGFAVSATMAFSAIDPVQKAERAGEAIITRTSRLIRMQGFCDYSSVDIKTFGDSAPAVSYRDKRKPATVILHISVAHKDQRALFVFSREAVSMCQALEGLSLSGRPIISPATKCVSFPLCKEKVSPVLDFDGKEKPITIPRGSFEIRRSKPICDYQSKIPEEDEAGELVEVPLLTLAYACGSNEGDIANLAVIARRREFVPYIQNQVTAIRAEDCLAAIVRLKVNRYDIPGVLAFNYVYQTRDSAGEYGILSPSHLSKSLVQLILSMPVYVPSELIL